MATHDSTSSSMTVLNTDPLATFQIIEKIGEGNSTSVYKALNKITDKLVAIKVFPFQPDYPYDSEIQFLRKLDHPFIDKLIEIYGVGQQVWMIFDYCQLGSIADIIRMTGEPLSEAEISCICYNVLYALDYVHSLGRAHGNVKASNILVNSLGQIKLTDFGNALWMGPQDDDYSGDMWALGLCLIELVEGNTLACQRQGRQPAYRTQQITKTSNGPEYSAELKDLISQCLQVDPKRRPKASKLFDHPFICKHKRDLPQIRKRLYQTKMEKISEFRRSLTARTKSQPPQIQQQQEQQQETVIEKSIGGGEENVPDESYMTSNTVYEIAQRLNNNDNTIEYTLESDGNYLASAVKPSFNLTEDASHIEMSNRNPIFTNMYPAKGSNPQDSISHIKIVHQDDSHEQSFNITARSEQLSIISKSSRLCFTAAKKGARVPPLNINSTAKATQGKAAFGGHNHYKSENIYSKENNEDLAASIVPFKSVQTHHHKSAAKPKMYKATNESNFRVKHTISLTSMNTHLNCSVDTESTLNPISADRQRLTQKLQSHRGPNTTRQLIEGLENFTANIPRTSVKSTATGSKGTSGRCKSIFQTPKTNECKQSKQSTVLKVVKENLEHGRRVYTEETPSCVDFLEKTRKPRVEIERAKLEMQMKKELEEIKKKYNTMFRGLGKSVDRK